MERRVSWMERMAQRVWLEGETLPGESVVELAGDRRILVEGHGGVTQYSREQICVKVRYGYVSICGSGLELRHMSRETLCILGCVDSIRLERRN